jgi:flavodoxin I
MKSQVIYFSNSGHTKKIADAIASALDVNAENVKDATLHDDTFIFIGSGCYGGKPGKDMTRFIEENTFNTREVALFGTSGGGEGKEVEEMEILLKSKNAQIKGRYFCKGRFLLWSRGRPNTEDIDQATKFAQRMIQ